MLILSLRKNIKFYKYDRFCHIICAKIFLYKNLKLRGIINFYGILNSILLILQMKSVIMCVYCFTEND